VGGFVVFGGVEVGRVSGVVGVGRLGGRFFLVEGVLVWIGCC